jgi:hypothetical protein
VEPLELIARAEARLQTIYKENYGIEVDVCMLELLLAQVKLQAKFPVGTKSLATVERILDVSDRT